MTIGPSIWSFNCADLWLERVKSLRILKDSKASKEVPDVSISWGAKIIVRISRTPKELLESEVEALASEYAKTKEELLDLFTSRKVSVRNESGDIINKRQPKPKSGRPKGKANAGNKRRGRQSGSSNELLQPGADPDLPQESIL